MKIEHIAMYVEHIEHAKQFFIKYFNGKAGEKYNNKKTGFTSYFLSFDDGVRLEIMNKKNVNAKDIPNRFGYIHLAFKVMGVEPLPSVIAYFGAFTSFLLEGQPARQRLKNEKSFKICIMTDESSLFIVNFYVGNEKGAVNAGSIGEHFEVAYVKIYLNKPVKVRFPSP